MIDTDKYEGVKGSLVHSISTQEWKKLSPAAQALLADAPLLLAEVKRLREGIRSILSDYDITELIRDVPEDEWNFEQQALIRMKELIE
jgi:hypothetical protein